MPSQPPIPDHHADDQDDIQQDHQQVADSGNTLPIEVGQIDFESLEEGIHDKHFGVTAARQTGHAFGAT